MDIPNEMVKFFSSASLRITCDPPLEWTLDGEREAETARVEVKNLHSVVKLVIPHEARHNPILLPEDNVIQP